jgi:hypothetical protein
MSIITSWEANSHSAGQEIPRLLWKPKVPYRDDKNPPLDPILDQMHPVHTFSVYFFKIRSNIILPPTPWSSEWSLSFRFSDQNFVCVCLLSHAYYVPYQSSPPPPPPSSSSSSKQGLGKTACSDFISWSLWVILIIFQQSTGLWLSCRVMGLPPLGLSTCPVFYRG